VFVLISGSLWRGPGTRQSKTSGKPFVTALLKAGTPTDALWCNVVAFDQAAQSELLRLQTGDALSVQGTGKISVFEKAGEHRASLDVTAAHVLALRQPKPAKAKQDTTSRKAGDRETAPTQPEFDDAVPF
jgi:single-stranded DNA-binding protein